MLRFNQSSAIETSIQNDFQSGVHFQATGTGKSWIAMNLIEEYQKKYPQCMNPESKKSDEYNKIIMETMEGGVKNKEKIIRKIAKEVVIEK